MFVNGTAKVDSGQVNLFPVRGCATASRSAACWCTGPLRHPLRQKNAGNVFAGIRINHDEGDLARRPLAQVAKPPPIKIGVDHDADLVLMTPHELQHNRFLRLGQLTHGTSLPTSPTSLSTWAADGPDP